MDVTIKISDDRLKEIIENDENALTREEIRNVVCKSIEKSIEENPNIVRDAFVRYDSRDYRQVPTPLLERIIESIDVNNDLCLLKNRIIELINNNLQDLVVEALIKLIISGITNNIDFKDSMIRDLKMFIAQHR